MKHTSMLMLLSTLFIAATPNAIAKENSEPKLPMPIIKGESDIPLKSVNVLGSEMSYLDAGTGETILFVHGNPTSSHLWRNVIPFVATSHRSIALDLIGMGNSDKPNIEYTFSDHYRYFSAFIEKMNLNNLTLVGHDWGAALAWEYARNNPGKVQQLAFMEGVLPPRFPAASFESFRPEMGGLFQALRNPAQGKQMIMEENMFVEQILPAFINRPLDEATHAIYRAPYVEKSSRLPTLKWPTELPIGGEPASVVSTFNNIEQFMRETNMPVLMLYASPGAIVSLDVVDWYTKNISKIETQFVGQGLHFIQEDQPEAIGRAVSDWLRRE